METKTMPDGTKIKNFDAPPFDEVAPFEYEWGWERFRLRGNWSLAVHLLIPPGQKFVIGIQCFTWVVTFGQRIKRVGCLTN
jgi:hypothetical protein